MAYKATLNAIPDGPTEQGVIEAGEAAAQTMLDARDGDGYMAPFTRIGTEAGEWRPTAAPTPALDPDPWVGYLEAVRRREPVQFRSAGPNALTSGAYAEDYAEVKELGSLNSTRRTADQTTAAIFWQFPPAALYNRMARELAAPARYGLDTFEQARLYAMVNLAMADGAISCWNDKYHWNFWRPRAAIREGETDGNPRPSPTPWDRCSILPSDAGARRPRRSPTTRRATAA